MNCADASATLGDGERPAQARLAPKQREHANVKTQEFHDRRH